MNNSSTLSEKSLIENCINGNRKSQKELYERFSPKMFSICLWYATKQTDAENILQHGFVKLFNNLYRYKGHERFEGWVERIFVKASLEHTKQTKVGHYEMKDFKNIIEVRNNNALDNVYEKVYIRTSAKCNENSDTLFKLYAIDGCSKNEATDKSALTQTSPKAEFQFEKQAPTPVPANRTADENKKIKFSYTIHKGDCKRINKDGILKVYSLSEPINIPVGRLLGQWKKEHIGITLVAINDKWCIKGGQTEFPSKAVVKESFSFNMLKRLVW